MSKTDKTRPWWVRIADAPMVTCAPVHDHRFGPCTLRDEITAVSASVSYAQAAVTGAQPTITCSKAVSAGAGSCPGSGVKSAAATAARHAASYAPTAAKAECGSLDIRPRR